MSPHRRHYLDLNEGPAPQDTGRAMQLALAAFFALLLVVWVLADVYSARAPVIRPVRTTTAHAFELPPISAEEARIEGFRAGMATCADQGPRPQLSQPIATE